jgi:hypothetical protein
MEGWGRLTSPEMAEIASLPPRVATLRGAGVDVDLRRVARWAGLLVLSALAVTVAALFVAGAHRNAQVTRLRRQGVPVQVTVTSCLGLLGGSGSNAAGYTCRGSFALAGRRYDEVIPGIALRPVGSTLSALAVPGDPALMAPVSQVAAEHPSAKVYLLPGALAAVLALGAGTVVLVSRRSARPGPGQPALRSLRGRAEVSRLGVAEGRV